MRPIILTAALIAIAPAASDAAQIRQLTVKPPPEIILVQPFGLGDGTQVINPFGADARCPETPMSLARKRGERPMLRHLDELPPAEAFAAVDRRIDNCPAPMYLRETKGR